MITALVSRTKIAGISCTSYKVYIPVSYKTYKPIVAGTYATEIVINGEHYYTVDDYLRTPALDMLAAFSDERLQAFRRLRRKATRIEYLIAVRAFPELRMLNRIPLLWADWARPSEDKFVELNIRNYGE